MRTPAMPLDRQARAGVGLQYQLNPNVKWGVAYGYVDLGDDRINQQGGDLRGDLKGEYEKNHIQGVGFNLVWKF